MARKRLPFAPFLPDLPPSGQCVVADNVFPAQEGYIPVGEFQQVTPALANISGGVAYVGSDGTSTLLAGDGNALWKYNGATWEQAMVALSAKRWRFTQFGDNAVAVYGGAPIKHSLTGSGASLVGGSPPDADLVATVRDFVVLAGDPAARQTVTWSGINNLEEWDPTDEQSDSQELPDGGEVMGLAGGEYGIILQRNAIKRMSYVGAPVIFQIDTISSNIGCMAKGSVAQAGRLVFFLSERGFHLTDGNDVRPIGAEKVDRTFFATYSRQDIENGIYAAVDPRRNIVMWSMPGTPGLIWCYHYVLDRWTNIRVPTRLVFSGFTANIPIDALDARYGNLDAIPFSLDDPMFAGGNPLLLIAQPDGTVGTFGGAPMAGRLGFARFELSDGRARLRTLRPITDAQIVTAVIGGSPRSDRVPFDESAIDMRRNGDIPCRVNAREFTPTLTFSGTWSYATAVDAEWEEAGRR